MYKITINLEETWKKWLTKIEKHQKDHNNLQRKALWVGTVIGYLSGQDSSIFPSRDYLSFPARIISTKGI